MICSAVLHCTKRKERVILSEKYLKAVKVILQQGRRSPGAIFKDGSDSLIDNKISVVTEIIIIMDGE
jgi:hypothetical protein